MSKDHTEEMNTTIICVYGCGFLIAFIAAIIWMICIFWHFLITPESECGVGSTTLTLVFVFFVLYIGNIVKAVFFSVKNAILRIIDHYSDDNE